MWSIHMVEYHLVPRRNGACHHMDELEHMVLSDRRQAQKPTYYMIPCIQNMQQKQTYRDRKQIRGCQGLEGGAQE